MDNPKIFYFCSPFCTILSDGVMVALQILVLPVKVRILVGQHVQESLLLFLVTGFFVGVTERATGIVKRSTSENLWPDFVKLCRRIES